MLINKKEVPGIGVEPERPMAKENEWAVNLLHAIWVSAVNDYREGLERRETGKKRKYTDNRIRECENFFEVQGPLGETVRKEVERQVLSGVRVNPGVDGISKGVAHHTGS